MNKCYIYLINLFLLSSFIFSNDTDHLIFNRIALSPNEAEMVSIYNPTDSREYLNNTETGVKYYLTDGIHNSSNLINYTNIPFINKSAVRGYSTEENIPLGCGTLVQLDIDGNATGLSEVLFKDQAGNNLNYVYYQGGENINDGCDLPANNIYLENNTVFYNSGYDCMLDCDGFENLNMPSEDPSSFCSWNISVLANEQSGCLADCFENAISALNDVNDFCLSCISTGTCNQEYNQQFNYDPIGLEEIAYFQFKIDGATFSGIQPNDNGDADELDFNLSHSAWTGTYNDFFIEFPPGAYIDPLETIYISMHDKAFIASTSNQEVMLELQGEISLECLNTFEFTDESNSSLSFGGIYQAEDTFTCTDDVCLVIDNNNLSYISNSNIHGFQFNHNGCIQSVERGANIPNGIEIVYNASTISGVSRTHFYGYYNYEPDFNVYELMNEQEFFLVDMLADNPEVLILYRWDGSSYEIKDVDYFLWGSNNETRAINKTNIPGYFPDTNAESQSYLPVINDHYSYFRNGYESNFCCLEYGEVQLDEGNGITGHDETSEKFEYSWTIEFNPERTLGCSDPTANNFTHEDNIDFNHEICEYNYGCTQEFEPNGNPYFNYDPEATKEYNATIGLDNLPVLDIKSSCIDTTDSPPAQIRDILNGEYTEDDDNDPDIVVTGKVVSFRLIDDTFFIIVIRDEDNYQIDIAASDWNIENSRLSYLVNPYQYTDYIVSVYGDLSEYNGTPQLAINNEYQIDDYQRLYTHGQFVNDYNNEIIKAKIVTAPYVIVPTLGERLDFKYSFPSNSRVIIRVFSLDGRFITSLIDKYYEDSGSVLRMEDLSDWDGRDHIGQIVAPGTYLFHIEATNFQSGHTSTDTAPVVVGVNK